MRRGHYFDDVLRGLAALIEWSERRDQVVPLGAIEPVLEHLLRSFPDGVVCIGRFAPEGVGTRAIDAGGAWTRQPASRFALLDEVSRVGSASAALTRQWAEMRHARRGLHEAGRIEA